MADRRVTFIGIGVQKAATSWLHDKLSSHPQVETAREKETNFFTSRYDRGHLWYERQFMGNDLAARGESSPTYFYSVSAPERAAAYNSRLRLLCILRDPLSRAFSNHLHEIRKGHIDPDTSFEEALEANPMYVEQGRYATHLSRWISVFGREPLLVLLAEDIAADPWNALAAVCRHIGVDEDVQIHDIGKRSHESVASRNRAVEKALRAGGDGLRAMGFGSALEAVKQARGIRTLLAINRRDLRDEIEPMRDDTRLRLAATFQTDVRFVSELLGRPALPWQSQGHFGVETTVDGRAAVLA